MKKIALKIGGERVASITTPDMILPDLDDSYTEGTYTGEKLSFNETHKYGIKYYGGTANALQGCAIYGDTLVRMADTGTSTNHYVYKLNSGGVSGIATFTMADTGHSNALQFASTILDGQILPYLYVSDVDGKCYVLSFDEYYQATIVQTITIANSGQILMGSDGFIWSSQFDDDDHRVFAKYRHVDVSEGASVTLTAEDKIDEWHTAETFPSGTFTSQGWKVKFGKIFFHLGGQGNGKFRGVYVYDTATHRLSTVLDLSYFSTNEHEDLDFWNDSMIVCTYGGPVYMVKV